MDFGARATANFESCNRRIALDLKDLFAKASVAGSLRSGATVIESLRIFEEQSSAALSQTLDETANQVEHRGKRWSRAMDEVSDALETQMANATVVLEKPMKFADAVSGNDASRKVEGRLGEIKERLTSQLSEFREGWTAPKAKLWKDRHPTMDRVIFLIIGAVIAAGAGWTFGLLG